MFEVAESYEITMGRWSRRLAPLFLQFVGVRDGERVLDVGCGTGALSSTLASMTGAAKIVGIDPSAAFIQAARSQITDPRVTIELGDAQNLPYADASFDRCLALLIVNFPRCTEGSERNAPRDEVRGRGRDHNVGRQQC